jgi:SAM-dependent methyltransferase
VLNPTSFAAAAATAATSSPTRVTVAPSFPPRDKCRVLILGCGNSTFGEDMMRDGWTGKITNVDFSSVVIEQMKSKYNDAFYERLSRNKNGPTPVEPMDFICADVTEELQFADESFDLVVCKGSFDAVLCSAGSVANIRHLTEECVRLLTGNGVFFLVTHGNPDNRIVFLEYQNDIEYYWESNIMIHPIPRPSAQKCVVCFACACLRVRTVSYYISFQLI